MRISKAKWTIMFVVLLFSSAISAQQVIPERLIPFQAYLTDDANKPLNGVFKVTFSIYSSASGGAVLWVETHATASVLAGRLNVLLGGVTSLNDPDGDGNVEDGLLFEGKNGEEKFLGITVGDQSPEMIPRHQLVPAFQAAIADVALSVVPDGIDGLNIRNGTISGVDIANGSITKFDIDPGTITFQEIDDNTIRGSNIADGTISSLDLGDSSVRGSELGFGWAVFSANGNSSFNTTERWRFCALSFFSVGGSHSGAVTCDIDPLGSGSALRFWRITSTGPVNCSMLCFGKDGE